MYDFIQGHLSVLTSIATNFNRNKLFLSQSNDDMELSYFFRNGNKIIAVLSNSNILIGGVISDGTYESLNPKRTFFNLSYIGYISILLHSAIEVSMTKETVYIQKKNRTVKKLHGIVI